MRRLPLIALFVFACVGSLSVSSVDAQSYYGPSYRPSRPTISPYFQLYNRNSSPVGNYHGFVRPRQQVYRSFQQQNRTNQQQNRINQRQSSDLRSLGQQVLSIRESGSLRPTGTGSTFMNYSHYYNFRQSGR